MATRNQGAFTAYLINPTERTIEEVALSGGADHLQAIYNLLDCKIITTAPLGEHDSIYCDDEGLLHGPVYQYFGVKGFAQPIAGRGLVIGLDAEGNDTAPKYSLDDVKARIFFIERLFRDAWSIENAATSRWPVILPLAQVEAMLSGEVCHG